MNTNAVKAKFESAAEREEKRLTELYKFLNVTDYSFTDRRGRNSYSGYDSDFFKDEKHYVVEAKVRNFDIDRYPQHLLEEDKLRFLVETFGMFKKMTIYYIMFFTDGVIMYNLTNRIKRFEDNQEGHQFEFEERDMPADTASGMAEMIKKSVTNQSFDKTLGDWKKIYETATI